DLQEVRDCGDANVHACFGPLFSENEPEEGGAGQSQCGGWCQSHGHQGCGDLEEGFSKVPRCLARECCDLSREDLRDRVSYEAHRDRDHALAEREPSGDVHAEKPGEDDYGCVYTRSVQEGGGNTEGSEATM